MVYTLYYTQIYVYIYIYIRVYTYIYIYIYIYTHEIVVYIGNCGEIVILRILTVKMLVKIKRNKTQIQELLFRLSNIINYANF